MSTVSLTSESFEVARNTIVQYLRDAGYDGDLEDGTGIYDTVITPNALLYELFSQEVNKSEAYMSLQRASDLQSELTEDEYDDAVDCVLSNWFVTRNTGTYASGELRLFFSECPDYLGFTDAEVIASYNDISFAVNGTVAFGENDFNSIVNTTSNTTEYYADVPVIATEASSDAITQDATFDATISNIYFLRATAVSDFTSGTDEETSEEFIERTEEAITTRELITSRAINTVIPNEFPEARRLYTAGHGKEEMIRDIVFFNEVPVHVGNMADIWVACELVKSSETCEVADDGTITLTNSPVHIYSIVDDETGEECEFTLNVELDKWLRPDNFPVSLTVTLPDDTEDEEEEEDESTSSDSENDTDSDDDDEDSDDNSEEDEDNDSTTEPTVETWSDRYTDTDGNSVSYTVTMYDYGSYVETVTETTTTYTDGTTETTTVTVVSDGSTTTVTSTDADGNETTSEGIVTEDEEEEEEDEDGTRTVTVYEYTSSLPGRIQDFVYDEDHRVASYDPQVRMMVPVVMKFDLTVTYFEDDTGEIPDDSDAIRTAICDYFEELSESGDPWSESAMLKRIHTDVESVNTIQVPIGCTITYFDMETNSYVSESANNTLDFSSASKQITSNTTQLYTNDDLITINGE